MSPMLSSYVCRCGSEISEERWALGYRTCMECGDSYAKRLINEMESRVGPIYNKGPDQYLGSPESTRHILKTAGSRKHLPLEDSDDIRSSIQTDTLRTGSNTRAGSRLPERASSRSERTDTIGRGQHIHDTSRQQRRSQNGSEQHRGQEVVFRRATYKAVGIYWLRGEKYLIRPGQQPPKGAISIIYF